MQELELAFAIWRVTLNLTYRILGFALIATRDVDCRVMRVYDFAELKSYTPIATGDEPYLYKTSD